MRLPSTPFEIDLSASCLRKDGEAIPLRPKTWTLLTYLIERAGELVTKDEILDRVWGGAAVAEEIISVSVRELRRALGDETNGGRYIQTVHRRGYRFIASTQTAPAIAQSSDARIPFVSRRQELAQLHDAVEKARHAQPQLVLVSGEAGIGKTTLVQHFLDELTAGEHDVIAATGQCFEEFRGEEPFCPVLDILAQLARSRIRSEVFSALRNHAPTWLLQVPNLVHEREHAELRQTWSGETHEQRLHNLLQAMDAITARSCLVLVIEDFHWSDSATADFVSRLATRPQAARMLLLCTQRPAEASQRGNPFAHLLHELVARRRCTKIDLPRLNGVEIGQYLYKRFAGASVPAAVSRWFCRQTDGNPLFMVNVADELVLRHIAREDEGKWVLEASSTGFDDIPESLRSIIEHRCSCLSADERLVLEAASIDGVRFTDEAVESAIGEAANATERLGTLARKHQMIARVDDIRWPDGTIVTNYVFQHAMYRDVLRDAIPARRRVEWHRRIGNRMESAFASEPISVAIELVEHFDQGLDPMRSANYLAMLGANAVQRFAYPEATLYFKNALTRIQDLPGNDEYKLFLAKAQGAASLGSTGYGTAECGQYLRQVQQMVERLNDDLGRGWVLGHFAGWHALRGEHRASVLLAEQLVELSARVTSEHFHSWGRFIAAMENAWTGRIEASIEHYRAGAARFDDLLKLRTDPNIPPEAKTIGMCGAAMATFAGGDPQAALDLVDEAHRYSRDQIGHQFGRLLSVWTESVFHALLGNISKAGARAAEAIEGTAGRGMAPFADVGRIVAGWALVMQGELNALGEMEAAWQAHKGLRGIGPSICLLLLAQARHKAAHHEEALAAVTEALDFAEREDERLFEPEILGFQAELIMFRARGNGEKAACAHLCLERAQAIATQHGMKLWETRTAARAAKLLSRS